MLHWNFQRLQCSCFRPFFLKNVKVCHFCHETLSYDVFGPIILDSAPGEFFCSHLYAWRRGRILIMPDHHHHHQTSGNAHLKASCFFSFPGFSLYILWSFLWCSISLFLWLMRFLFYKRIITYEAPVGANIICIQGSGLGVGLTDNWFFKKMNIFFGWMTRIFVELNCILN